MKEINNFSFQTSLCLADGVSFPHKNGQNWVVGRMDSFSPVFVSDLKRGNYFSALEMLSNAINRGRAETEKKKVLNFFQLQKFFANVLNAVGITAEVQNVISKVDMVFVLVMMDSN